MKEVIKGRVEKLRREMREHSIDAYLIVSDDFHSSEYVCDYFKCRQYISGFTGSAGTLLVTLKEAKLWTDGRYFLQAAEQLEGTDISLMKSGEEGVSTIQEYLEDILQDGDCLGYDGRTLTVAYADLIKESLSKKKIIYKEDVDLVGNIWEHRPELPKTDLWLISEEYVGKSRREKLEELRTIMRQQGADMLLLSSLDDIAWLYNFRAGDIEYNPVALCYTMVYEDKAILYRKPETVNEDIVHQLQQDGILIAPYFQVYEDVRKLKNTTILLDESTVNVALRNAIPKDVSIVSGKNPTTLAKAKKNIIEMKNERYAHILDGVAVTKLIYWLKQKYLSSENITELDVCEKLEQLRKQGDGYLQQSFAPIIATGAHGAIVHYEPTEESNIPLEKDNFVLMDTGGQYLYGTTDITRTIAYGQLTREQKIHYTAVLKGHLNLAGARFKYGCTGVNLDYLARRPLWELGLDYNHGTGHGVGYLMNVHEGPNAIRTREADGTGGTVFEEGMITSNEPGLYLEGKYGIRIENLMLCVKDQKTEYGQFMKFDTLTLVPYEREAILPEMMSDEELRALNHYHKMVYERLSPYLDNEEKQWLLEQTTPLA